ncbi:hypothetical protein IWX87_002370 [Polaromonas sp. CG_9.7]|uniref:hypothetical protein n=1 Tax=Polaromonas sp. CG_23.6 TaxID=2760709 RepID=UPI001A1EB43A|nr:hypothetical protein [Polaromonas sp. CG_23.6]MBG6072606.1 hypothetical protein [Polaromonas sp. CG_9.7]MBG6114674.1 hypothetical protein [Polaromonas sp. CG_9.2]MDH6185161.1 hypothetical protein [Polaromonas sp. CG_23.6]
MQKIHYEAVNGTLTLACEVDIYPHKQRARYAAQRVAGIKPLVMHIHVGPRNVCASRPLLTTFSHQLVALPNAWKTAGRFSSSWCRPGRQP